MTDTPFTDKAQAQHLGKTWDVAYKELLKASKQLERENALMRRVLEAIRGWTPYPELEAKTCLEAVDAMRREFEEGK